MPQGDPSPQSRELDRFGHGWQAAARALRGTVSVVSPHLDDAVLSLGASMAGAAGAGSDVRVLNVFAGDPASTSPASDWDAKGGYRSLGEAARARRLEDTEACRRLGVIPTSLAFPDDLYAQEMGDDDLWNAIAPLIEGSDLVLAPGFPLIHQDHLRLCRLLRAHVRRSRLGYYVEQPYAAWFESGFSTRRPNEREVGRLDGEWRRLRVAPWFWVAKLKAMRSYNSQMKLLHQPAKAILRYELVRGGETVALPAASGL